MAWKWHDKNVCAQPFPIGGVSVPVVEQLVHRCSCCRVAAALRFRACLTHHWDLTRSRDDAAVEADHPVELGLRINLQHVGEGVLLSVADPIVRLQQLVSDDVNRS